MTNYDNLIFLHIPKAAGSTLHSVLERNYSKSTTRTITVRAQLEAFKQSQSEERRKVRLLKGHMPFGMHDYLNGQSTYITLLRQPAERLLSHYCYAKRKPDHYLHRHIATGMTVADFISSGISGELDNGQVRLLSGHDQDIPFGHCTRELLEIAQKNIDNHFAVVGLLEHFDESLILMRILLGWYWIPYYISRNTRQRNPAAKPIDAATLEVIQQTNALDIELYNWVAQRFRAEIDRHQDEVTAGMARLDLVNKVYRPWGTMTDAIKHILKTHLPMRTGLSK